MNITRFEPWSFVDLLQGDVDRAANPRSRSSATGNRRHWLPAVDIIEEKARFLLRADVPGVDPADIDVAMDNGILTVSGVRHAEERSEDAGMQRVERSSGRFYRRFTLPESVDTDGITAKVRNGILELIIPKQPEVQARRIEVEAA